jgi:hypothetical protein
MNDTVLVALIGAGGVVAAAVLPSILVQISRRENNRDHATVASRLEDIDSHLGVVEAKVEHVQYGLATHLLEHKREELEDGHTRRSNPET